MSEYFLPLDYGSGFRQGDIIRCFENPVTQQGASWGFVINADCDLANRKNQGHISWLEVVTTRQYWRDIWAPQHLAKFAEKLSLQICEQMNSLVKKRGFNVDDLNYAKLGEWVERDKPEQIVADLAIKDLDLTKRLYAFSRSIRRDDGASSVEILDDCQKIIGQKPEKNTEAFKKFITRQDGFPDFFLVPDIPDGNAKGYIVLLRRINGSKETEVFKTHLDARLNDQPEAFHRIGRFKDGIRFQIVQKMTFLYSRIGSPEDFEADCTQVIDWSVESEGTYQ